MDLASGFRTEALNSTAQKESVFVFQKTAFDRQKEAGMKVIKQKVTYKSHIEKVTRRRTLFITAQDR